MPDANHGAAGDSPAQAIRRKSRRRKAVIGVTGLALALGTGSYVLAERLTAGDEAEQREVIAQPLPGAEPASPEASPPAPTAGAQAAMPETEKPAPQVSAEIMAARSRAAADGHELQRARGHTPKLTSDDVTVTQSGSLEQGHTLKVVSARGDLTDYEELGWLGDQPKPAGKTDCTQKFQLATDREPTERPTLLLCWRITAQKSAYTVAVNLKGRPDRKESVAALEKAWSKLS
ncbi:hypothetical protein Aut01nite_17530 [Actinoplanes utahensis]|nr:hypothetical protein Aut01nite_17530 [Actinoplanes utahensis]